MVKKSILMFSLIAITFSGCASSLNGVFKEKKIKKTTCKLGHWDQKKQACMIVKGLKGVVKKVYDNVAFISLENGNTTYIEDKTLKVGDSVIVNIIKKENKND